MKRIAVLAFVVYLAGATATAQAAPKSAYFTTSDHVRIHYLEAGKGPALVFIPGWTMPADIWENQIAHFAKSYHVIAIDPRSQGDSDKPHEGDYPERRARDYKELLDALGVRTPVLVGWSMGVHEVLTFADLFAPASVRALVLVDGILWDKVEPELSSQIAQWMRGYQLDRRAATEQFVRSMYKKPQSEAYLRRFTEAALSTPTDSAVVLTYNLTNRESWTPALAKIASAKIPVLGVFTPPGKSTVELLRVRLPDAQLLTFDEAGHALFVDEAERFNKTLGEFLASLK